MLGLYEETAAASLGGHGYNLEKRGILAAYEERAYRLDCHSPGLQSFTARVKETDLWILAEGDLASEAVVSIMDHRRGLEAYIRDNPEFLGAMSPLPADRLAPPVVQAMLSAAMAAGTGPMAAVAGAIAEAVAGDLLRHSARVVVENGGDLYLAAGRETIVGLRAGGSPLSGRLGLKVGGDEMPLAVACSSGTVGHSFSLGNADAAIITAKSGALADACATALGNRVQGRADAAPALEWAAGVPGVLGALVVAGDKIGAWGELTLVDLAEDKPT